MSTTPLKNQRINPDNKKRSEEELLEEEIRNQQTVDIFVESEKIGAKDVYSMVLTYFPIKKVFNSLFNYF